MIKSNGTLVVEEDEMIYGEYGEMVDRRLEPTITDFSIIA